MTRALTSRILILLALIATVAALLVLASVREPVEAASPEELIFPVIGDHYYSNTFGACRGTGCSRRHHGVDIMTYGVKGVPVVAVDDGVVKYVNFSWTAEGIDPDRCCTLVIEHDDGYESWYLHLDNDTPGTDDGQGWGVAPGILPGVEVFAGQLVGWVGDSGNAENTAPHLHFEYHDPSGLVLDPTPYVDGAVHIDAPIEPIQYELDWSDIQQITYPGGGSLGVTAPDGEWWVMTVQRRGEPVFYNTGMAGSGSGYWEGSDLDGPYLVTFDLGELGYEQRYIQVGDYEWPFVDDEGSYARLEIEEMFERGITYGCGWSTFCPDRTVSREEVMTFIARALADGETPWPSYQGYYSDVPEGEWFTGPVEYLVEEGILPGGALGTGFPAERALMVDVLMNAMGNVSYGPYQGYFSDVSESDWFWRKVERAYELGITTGYPDGTFRPYNYLTREEAVALLMRGL